MREAICGLYGTQYLDDVGHPRRVLRRCSWRSGILVRPLMANVNRMVAGQVRQSGLFNGEDVEIPARPYRFSQLFRALTGNATSTARQLLRRSERFARWYPRLIRGSVALWACRARGAGRPLRAHARPRRCGCSRPGSCGWWPCSRVPGGGGEPARQFRAPAAAGRHVRRRTAGAGRRAQRDGARRRRPPGRRRGRWPCVTSRASSGADVKSLFANVMSIIIAVGLVVMPSIFTWYNVIACWNVFDNTGNLTVAVANVDDGYESDLVPLRVNVGEQVVSALRANDQIDWTFTTEEDAVDGARSGRYYAAVVIPHEFSRDMLTFYSEDVRARQDRLLHEREEERHRAQDHRPRCGHRVLPGEPGFRGNALRGCPQPGRIPGELRRRVRCGRPHCGLGWARAHHGRRSGPDGVRCWACTHRSPTRRKVSSPTRQAWLTRPRAR